MTETVESQLSPSCVTVTVDEFETARMMVIVFVAVTAAAECGLTAGCLDHGSRIPAIGLTSGSADCSASDDDIRYPLICDP